MTGSHREPVLLYEADELKYKINQQYKNYHDRFQRRVLSNAGKKQF